MSTLYRWFGSRVGLVVDVGAGLLSPSSVHAATAIIRINATNRTFVMRQGYG
jgi:hypothetical protein